MRLDYFSTRSNQARNEERNLDRVRGRSRNFLDGCKRVTEKYNQALAIGGLALIASCDRNAAGVNSDATVNDGGKADVENVNKKDAGKPDVFSSKDGSMENKCKEWSVTYANRFNLDDKGHAVAVDSQDNVIMIGETWEESGAAKILIKKLDRNGNELWSARQIDVYLSAADLASLNTTIRHDVGVDIDDNIIAVATVSIPGFAPRIWVRKLNGLTGEPMWTKTFDDNISNPSYAEGVVVSHWNAYILGATKGPEPNFRLWIKKLGRSGIESWEILGDGDSIRNGHDIAVPNDNVLGLVYLTGKASGYGLDFLTERTSPGGTNAWRDDYNVGADDQGFGIVVDIDSNVVVTGKVEGKFDPPASDLSLRKYDSEGNPIWARTISDYHDSSGLEIVTDLFGRYYTTGYKTDPTGKYKIGWTVGFDNNGNVRWERTHELTGVDVQGNGVGVDSNGCVIVTGEQKPLNRNYDAWIKKYGNPE